MNVHVSISIWEENVLILGKYEMFEYNLKMYICVLCIYFWLFGNTSLYKREYVCVNAWASAEGCIWEKENEYGKYTSSVK